MQRAIVIGIGDLGCATTDLPDDPERFAAFIAIHHADYVQNLWPNSDMYRVPRFKITDPCDLPDQPAHPVFVEHAQHTLEATMDKLLSEVPGAPIFLSMALTLDDSYEFSVAIDGEFGSALLREVGTKIHDAFDSLKKLLGFSSPATLLMSLEEISEGTYSYFVKAEIRFPLI